MITSEVGQPSPAARVLMTEMLTVRIPDGIEPNYVCGSEGLAELVIGSSVGRLMACAGPLPSCWSAVWGLGSVAGSFGLSLERPKNVFQKPQ